MIKKIIKYVKYSEFDMSDMSSLFLSSSLFLTPPSIHGLLIQISNPFLLSYCSDLTMTPLQLISNFAYCSMKAT